MRYERKEFKEQLSMMVHEIAKDPSIMTSSGRRLSRFDRLANAEQWKSLAAKLNTVKNGKQKTPLKWKQSWRDLVYKLKRKDTANGRASLTRFESHVLNVYTYFIEGIVNNASEEERNAGIKNPVAEGKDDAKYMPDSTVTSSLVTEKIQDNRKITSSQDSSDANKKHHDHKPLRRSARVLQMKGRNGSKH